MADDDPPGGRRVALPIAPGSDTEVRRRIREQAFEAFEAAGPLAATATMEALLDETLSPMFSTGTPLACARGCWWCCHVHVSVTAPEAMHAARWARAHLSSDALDALRVRLRSNAEGARGKSAGAYPRQPCAFLIDGACSIYEARPGHCRGAHSVDVEACKTAYALRPDGDAPIPAKAAARAASREARTGYLEALTHANLGRATYELQQVMHLLLEDPTAGARWMQGERSALDPRPCDD